LGILKCVFEGFGLPSAHLQEGNFEDHLFTPSFSIGHPAVRLFGVQVAVERPDRRMWQAACPAVRLGMFRGGATTQDRTQEASQRAPALTRNCYRCCMTLSPVLPLRITRLCPTAASSTCCRAGLDKQILEITDYRRIALRQFSRNSIVWRKQILKSLSAGCVLRLVRHGANPVEEPSARLGCQTIKVWPMRA
jgi:hypothetical protein